jgi:putative peptidoglycan lipid II flippase
LLNEKYGIYGLAVAFLIAWLLQAVVQIPALKKKGFYFKPSFSLKNEGMKKVFALMLPVMVSTWVLPINQTINSKFGSRLFDGAGVSAIELAYNLFTVIAGVFVLSVTNYIFPKLSRENADGDKNAFRDTISGTMHTTMFVVLPMTAGLFVMAEPIVSFLYGGGKFDEFSINITSRALMYMSLGMIGYAAQAVLCRVFFAEQNGKAPLIAGAVSIGVNIVLCAVLTERFDVAGIAISSAVSFAVNAILLALPLQKRGIGFFDKKFMADMLKTVISSVIMALAVRFMMNLLSGMGKIVILAVPVIVGVIVFFVVTLVLKVPETKLICTFAGKILKRRNG